MLFMTQRKLRFAIFGNLYQAKKSASIRRVLSCLRAYGAEITIDSDYHAFLLALGQVDMQDMEVFEGNDFTADFVISMGGDGTFLKAATRVGAKQVPIVGVNMGRLGFLADVSPEDIEESVLAIYNNEYALDERKVIQVEAEDTQFTGPAFALNDVSILKRDNASMIAIHAYLGGEYLTTYEADGLVVSTPTGSTAYSLSNGGPIIVPGTSVFSMTAVAPHSLNMRPIVISDSSVITLDVESRSHNFLVALDGRSERCKEGTRITIRRAPYKVFIVKRHSNDYFQTLREKMMWGADNRR